MSPTQEILSALDVMRVEIVAALNAFREEIAESRRVTLEAVDGLAEKVRRHERMLAEHDSEIARMRRAGGERC